MEKPIIAIDPGAAGGFSWVDSDGITHAEPMPVGMTAQADRLRSLAAKNNRLSAVLEKVGTYVPGNGGPATATFARHCGHLEAALYVLGVSTEQVSPSVWQRSLGALPSAKNQRKHVIRELMAKRHPHLTVTLKTADALGILTWAREKKFPVRRVTVTGINKE